jgi:hypothetical protein
MPRPSYDTVAALAMRSTATLPRVCACVLVSLLGAASVACEESPPASAYLTTPGGGGQYVRDTVALGHARLRPDVCDNVPENKPEQNRLDEKALIAFLQRQGYDVRPSRARSDLVYLDVTGNGAGQSNQTVRLRVAVLEDANAAGKDLHGAILQHGPGSWGVHRGNLAVLAPIGSMDQILEFAGRSKLACWGVLTVAARDDDFVVPGGYMEF